MPVVAPPPSLKPGLSMKVIAGEAWFRTARAGKVGRLLLIRASAVSHSVCPTSVHAKVSSSD